MRRFGEPVIPGQRYTTRPGAYAMILDGRDVLLTEQAEPYPEIQLPGGAIDPGEGAVRALHRECLEETGWRIRIERRVGAFQRYTYMPEYDLWAHKVCHVYLARAARRVAEPRDPLHRPLWMPIETAASQVQVPGDRHFLNLLAHRI